MARHILGASGVPSTMVELSISAKNLLDMDVMSKSDPMCVLYIKELNAENWKEFGRTEMIKNNLNPKFVKKFRVQYYFEQKQYLKFELYDIDSKSASLAKQDFLGKLECILGTVVSSIRIEKPLVGPKKNSGTIEVIAEELSFSKEEVSLKFSGEKLDKKDTFGKSDPFLRISKQNTDDPTGYTVVHETEKIKRTLNPQWQEFKIAVGTLCNGDYDRDLRFECFDWNSSGREDFIGEFSTTLRNLTRGPGKHNTYECINKDKRQKKGANYKNSGLVKLDHVKVQMQNSFLDYVQGGTHLHISFAIDFTSSNLVNDDPGHPKSLHCTNRNCPNPYARAIKAVGGIVEDYDSDKIFPAFGFGAKVPPQMELSHNFPLDGNKPECQGIDGVLEAYYKALNKVIMHGPTHFAPVIQSVIRYISQARKARPGKDYFILLILTDGVINDMMETKQAIVQAAQLPISIIIIGIGDEDFEAMQILDGDNERISYKGERAVRDIVQFVPFREFMADGQSDSKTDMRLAKEVLEEIPEQLVLYMESHHFFPNKTELIRKQSGSTHIVTQV